MILGPRALGWCAAITLCLAVPMPKAAGQPLTPVATDARDEQGEVLLELHDSRDLPAPGDQRVSVLMQDGQTLRGVLLMETPGSVHVEVSGVRMTLPREKIVWITPDRTIEDRAATTYFVSPSAFPMTAGDTELSLGFLSPSISRGVTDHISLSVGVIPVLWFLDFPELINFYLGGKASIALADSLHIAAGFRTLVIPAYAGAVAAFVGATAGDSNKHLTVNVVQPAAVVWSDGIESGLPILNIAGQTRVHRRVAVIAESWLVEVRTF